MKYGKFYYTMMTILLTFCLFIVSICLLALNPILGALAFCVTICFPIHRHLKKGRIEKNTAAMVDAGEVPAIEAQNLKHVAGLPVPVGSKCRMEAYNNKIVYHVDGSKKKFVVNMETVTDVIFYDEKEIRQYQKTSIGGAMLGSAIAGPVGAIIGAMPNTKDRTVIKAYCIAVLYNSRTDGQIIMASDSYSIKKTCDKIKEYAKIEENDYIM